jgi:hypothetical protein
MLRFLHAHVTDRVFPQRTKEEAALFELELDMEEIPGLGGWRTSSEDTATARVAYRQVRSAPRELVLDTQWRSKSSAAGFLG